MKESDTSEPTLSVVKIRIGQFVPNSARRQHSVAEMNNLRANRPVTSHPSQTRADHKSLPELPAGNRKSTR